MRIKYKSILTLDDNNDYVVAGVTRYDEREYIYLVDIHNHINMKFAEIMSDGSLLIINSSERELIDKLIPLFYNNVREIE